MAVKLNKNTLNSIKSHQKLKAISGRKILMERLIKRYENGGSFTFIDTGLEGHPMKIERLF